MNHKWRIKMGFVNYNFIQKISNTTCALHQMYMKSKNKPWSKNI